MSQTPAERRARRDATAQSRINPDTGLPFRNYNELDLWQRNQKAKARGFTSRAKERREKQLSRPNGPEVQKALSLPLSWEAFLAGRPSSERLAKEFNDAWNKQPKRLPSTTRFHRRALRARSAAMLDWDWDQWRNEYDAS
jgi:hypothetical protein